MTDYILTRIAFIKDADGTKPDFLVKMSPEYFICVNFNLTLHTPK
jgi:hypothetical protein